MLNFNTSYLVKIHNLNNSCISTLCILPIAHIWFGVTCVCACVRACVCVQVEAMDKLVNLTDTLKQEKKDETQKVRKLTESDMLLCCDWLIVMFCCSVIG